METPVSIRLDKWLWMVRLYKTRSLAAAACSAGKVHINGQGAKPSRNVHPGEIISAVTGEITRTVKVKGLLSRRVGAKQTALFLEDLTPPAEYEKPRPKSFPVFGFRPKGAGRPTKKDRRSIEMLTG